MSVKGGDEVGELSAAGKEGKIGAGGGAMGCIGPTAAF